MAAETQLDFILRFKDEASAQVDKAAKNLSNFKQKSEELAPTFQKIALAGTAAFASISAVGMKSIKDFGDAQKAAAMLEHAVIGVSGATQDQLKATSDLADELERKGVLDGDNIKMGLAQLSTFGLSNKAVQGLGGALADLAVNQNGVNATGEQLADTANTIAKALNGQFGVLEKSGIRFTEAQQKAIKFGTEMEKVDAINQGFAQNLKYTNEVALGTMEGQMAKNAVQIGNLSESLGAVLAPILTQITQAVMPLLTQLQKWIEANPELTKRIVLVAAGVAAVVAVIGTLGLIIPTLIAGFTALASIAGLVGTAFTVMLGPIGLVIVAVAALIYGGVQLYKHWDQVKAKGVEIWNSLKDFLEKNWKLMLTVFSGGLGGIVILLVENWDRIMGAWSSIWNAVKDKLVSVMDMAKGIITGVIDWVIEKINGAIALANSAIALANKIPGVDIQSITPIGGARANGGPVSGGVPYLVGERGPELFMPNSSGSIIPNGALAGGGGGASIVINIGNVWGTNPRAAAREIGDILIKELQQNRRITT